MRKNKIKKGLSLCHTCIRSKETCIDVLVPVGKESIITIYEYHDREGSNSGSYVNTCKKYEKDWVRILKYGEWVER